MQLETQNVNEDYQEISEFKYLGSLVLYDNDRGEDVRARITPEKWSYHSLSKIVKSKYIYIRTYKTKNVGTTTKLNPECDMVVKHG